MVLSFPRIIIESPYTATTAKVLIRNQNYLKACIRDSIARCEAPFAGHFFYTQFLNDRDPRDRRLGMLLARSWLSTAALVAVYVDLGISPGMKQGIRLASVFSVPTEERSIPDWERDHD